MFSLGATQHQLGYQSQQSLFNLGPLSEAKHKSTDSKAAHFGEPDDVLLEQAG